MTLLLLNVNLTPISSQFYPIFCSGLWKGFFATPIKQGFYRHFAVSNKRGGKHTGPKAHLKSSTSWKRQHTVDNLHPQHASTSSVKNNNKWRRECTQVYLQRVAGGSVTTGGQPANNRNHLSFFFFLGLMILRKK